MLKVKVLFLNESGFVAKFVLSWNLAFIFGSLNRIKYGLFLANWIIKLLQLAIFKYTVNVELGFA